MECSHNHLFALEAPILDITYNLMLKRERRHDLCISIIGAAPLKDYEFLPLDPNQPLSHNIVYRGMKSQLQVRVGYNRCQVKQECFEVWKNTPEAEKEALWTTLVFSWIDRDLWANLCAYYDSEDKKEEARRNAQNRASNLHGRATYTGGSRNISRAMKCQIIEDGGTPTMLKLYLGTHSSSVDKITGEYTYPDNNTKEYCVTGEYTYPDNNTKEYCVSLLDENMCTTPKVLDFCP
ncbi:uncharacterized protein A4U43_UnF6440 [Asparagus officinalis]|uniref:Uncharacterized protein n=1 Tax=Asparagus officinalis TaxID=4686 RepID=A0A1R3L6G5_ASPOF|nr:uncharacterized protein A4U43_UnF6440 [Asparagus officinalis]